MYKLISKLSAAVAIIIAGLALGGFQPLKKDAPVDIVVGVQATGTAQWEMSVIKSNKLDEKHGVNLIVRGLADSRAGKIALLAGEVDIILSDFVWVSIQRSRDVGITIVPHSLAVGGIMVNPDAGINSVADLPGKTIGIAGGPVDKSWIVLQAYYAAQTGDSLADKVTARFGPPPLINEILARGEVDAALNFWHFNARSKAAGMIELKPVSDMLAESGIDPQPPLLGWAFSEETAKSKKKAVKGFLDASFDAKKILLEDDATWDGLRELMRAADDDALFQQLQEDYRKGIVTKYGADVIAPATASFEMMAKYGGSDLVGDVPTLAEGTFWSGYRRR